MEQTIAERRKESASKLSNQIKPQEGDESHLQPTGKQQGQINEKQQLGKNFQVNPITKNNAPNFHELFQKGVQMEEDENYEQAIKCYQEAEKLGKKKSQLYSRMAIVYQMLQNYDMARYSINQLEYLDPKAVQQQDISRIYKKYWKSFLTKEQQIKQKPYISRARRVGRNPMSYYKSSKRENRPSLIARKNRFSYKKRPSASPNQPSTKKSSISKFQEELQKLKFEDPAKVEHPSLYPYSAVGMILSRFQTRTGKVKTASGSGCLIGKNLVLTAAHNIYLIAENIQARQIRYIPASKYNQQKAAGFRVKNCFVALQFKDYQFKQNNEESQSELHDYAILQLDTQQDLQSQYGSFSYDFNWQETQDYLNAQQFVDINLIGFSQNVLKLYQGNSILDTNYLISKLPTTKGVSGAPNFEFVGQEYFVRAIHSKEISKGKVIAKAALKLCGRIFETLTQRFTQSITSFDMSNYTQQQNKRIKNEQEIKTLIQELSSRVQNNQKFQVQLRQQRNWTTGMPVFSLDLVEKPHKTLARQQSHNLDNNNIQAEGCEYLALSEWPNLQELRLRKNKIGNQGCEHLVSAHWPNLRKLNLDINQIGDKGCYYLAKPNWHSLEKLSISYNEIGDEGCSYLARAQYSNLQTLYINNNEIGDNGCKYLSQAHWRRQLEIFRLSHNKIQDQGCKHLAAFEWENLQQLHLDYNEIGDQGCQHLLSARIYTRSKSMNLGYNKITVKDSRPFEDLNIRVFF